MHKKMLVVALSVVALGGCSSGPSEADIKDSMYKQMEAMAGSEGAKNHKGLFDSIKLVGCKKADSNGYVCDMTSGMGGMTGRFVETD